MRNTILAAAAAFALVVATAPSFAAPASENNGGQAQSQYHNSSHDILCNNDRGAKPDYCYQ